MLMKKLLLICFLGMTVSAFGQTSKAIEADLLKIFQRIDATTLTGANPSHSEPELTEQADNEFTQKFSAYLNKYPATLNQQFPLFEKEGLQVITSADGLFRVYCWNTGLGGTQQDYANIFQYKSGETTRTLIAAGKDETTKLPSYHKIYKLTVQGKTYYLGIYEAKMSTSEYEDGVQVFSVEKDSLNQEARIIKTKSGLHSRLNYSFVWHEEHPDEITFDEKTTTLKLPVILENGQANGNYMLYKFNGQYFERIKN